MGEAVIERVEGPVFWLVLNRPERLNAINLEMIEGLSAGLERAGDDATRCVVLRGEGRAFCSGGDIKAFHELKASGRSIPPEMPDRLHEMIERLRTLPKPVLAVVHGPSGGAGTSLALACDLVLAAQDSIFNLSYTRIGLSPDGSSSFFLPRHVGLKKATEIFLTGGNLSADEAQRLGLVNWVVPAEQIWTKAQEIALMLAAGPTLAFARVKRLLNESLRNDLHRQLALETKLICESSKTEDFREGIDSFLEKRPPRFRGA